MRSPLQEPWRVCGLPRSWQCPSSPRGDTEEAATERHLDLSVRPTLLPFAVSSSSSQPLPYSHRSCFTVTNEPTSISFLSVIYLAVLSSTGVHRAVTHLSSSSARPDCVTPRPAGTGEAVRQPQRCPAVSRQTQL